MLLDSRTVWSRMFEPTFRRMKPDAKQLLQQLDVRTTGAPFILLDNLQEKINGRLVEILECPGQVSDFLLAWP